MENFLIQILVISYAGAGIVNTVAYWPTIKDIYRKKPSANSSSYSLWTLTSLVSFLYSLFVLPDTLFRIVSSLNFLACGIILVLSLTLSRRNRI